jgi:ABC-type sugar transport system ATPase subunit
LVHIDDAHGLRGHVLERERPAAVKIISPPGSPRLERLQVLDQLNQQLLELWAATRKTVVFVTHSIPEAVFLSNRIVVMSPRPGRIIDIIETNFARDRTLDFRETPEFLDVAHRVRDGRVRVAAGGAQAGRRRVVYIEYQRYAACLLDGTLSVRRSYNNFRRATDAPHLSS